MKSSPGGVVLFTGLSGAGKSTLAAGVQARLRGSRPIEWLDGDQMREHLTKGLTFSRADRDTNVQRIAYVARLLAKHGVLALISLIAPYEQTRLDIRRRSEADGHPFLEVFVHAPLDTVVARDVKGLYKRALAGELPNFTGVSDPYEAPVDPTLEIRTDREDPESCIDRIVRALAERGLT